MGLRTKKSPAGRFVRRRNEAADSIGLESAVEDLGLSVRTRNAVRGLGCHTVEDAMKLDLSRFVRGLGQKTREELLTQLERAGFHHPMADDQPASEIRILEHSLARMQSRVDEAHAAVSREIRLLQQRLRKGKAPRSDQDSRTDLTRNGAGE